MRLNPKADWCRLVVSQLANMTGHRRLVSPQGKGLVVWSV